MPKQDQKIDLEQVTIRLFSDDIAAIKREAETERRKWQSKLREIVHDAVVARRKKPVIK